MHCFLRAVFDTEEWKINHPLGLLWFNYAVYFQISNDNSPAMKWMVATKRVSFLTSISNLILPLRYVYMYTRRISVSCITYLLIVNVINVSHVSHNKYLDDIIFYGLLSVFSIIHFFFQFAFIKIMVYF